MPVVDERNRVVGIVTQSDLIAALFQGRSAQAAEPAEDEGPKANVA